MDAKSRETLDTILAKDKDTLSEDEVQFLCARRGYLNDEQRKRFADILDEHEKSLKKGGSAPVGLAALSGDKLKALAKKHKVDITGLRKNADIVAALEAAGITAD